MNMYKPIAWKSDATKTLPNSDVDTEFDDAPSYALGFPARFSLDPTDPNALNIDRGQVNGLWYTVSYNLWKLQGGYLPSFDSNYATHNNGYDKGIIVYNADKTRQYISLKDNNTDTLDVATSWREQCDNVYPARSKADPLLLQAADFSIKNETTDLTIKWRDQSLMFSDNGENPNGIQHIEASFFNDDKQASQVIRGKDYKNGMFLLNPDEVHYCSFSTLDLGTTSSLLKDPYHYTLMIDLTLSFEAYTKVDPGLSIPISNFLPDNYADDVSWELVSLQSGGVVTQYNALLKLWDLPYTGYLPLNISCYKQDENILRFFANAPVWYGTVHFKLFINLSKPLQNEV